MTSTNVSVAAFQGQAIYSDIPKALKVIKETLQWAESKGVDILCFPECYLQGYTWSEEISRKVSIELHSADFKHILEQLHSYKTTVILGVIERDAEKIYNTAVVIEKGKLLGKYQKCHIHNKEEFFTCGTAYPIFKKKGIKYGINICYDSRFPDSTEALAKQGAQVIFSPLNNSLPHAKADDWKDKHLPYFIEKAKQSGCWIVTSDVVDNSETHTGYGCTALVSPDGKVIEYLEHSKQGNFLRKLSLFENRSKE
ncbi:MAG TPA: carbon-nitrogen hydrolase family protein [Vitreimonas sp.]|nr:carbon-nitrogen hydrolase family protein [Vitreimonas sp.]